MASQRRLNVRRNGVGGELLSEALSNDGAKSSHPLRVSKIGSSDLPRMNHPPMRQSKVMLIVED